MHWRDVRENGYCLSLLTFVLFGLCSIQHSRAEEEVIKSGQCTEFYEFATTESSNSPAWTYGDACTVCNQENTLQSWFITKSFNTNNAELVHVNITMSFSECEKCVNQYLKVLVLHETLPKDIKEKDVIKELKRLTLLEKIENKTKANTKETYNIQFMPKSNVFSIVLLAEGACLIVYEFKVTSFVCKEDSIEGVHLPRTVTPASENRIVNASCVKDTAPSGSRVFGLCGSDGEWKYATPCFCKEGYTFGSKGCESCQKNTYKDNVGNEPCRPCPLNSESAPMATRCECKKGYYRVPGSSYAEPCHGIPSAVRELTFLHTDAKSLLIHWLPPLRAINNVSYDVECFRCIGEVCELPCGDKTTYRPSKFNLTALSVLVGNLEPNTHYMFTVRSKNNNSYLINENNWLSVRKRFETEGSCNDESKECTGYKDLGYCAPSHSFHECMKTTCPKTCGFCQVSCKDQNPNCSGWKPYCDVMLYVQNNCKKTCGTC